MMKQNVCRPSAFDFQNLVFASVIISLIYCISLTSIGRTKFIFRCILEKIRIDGKCLFKKLTTISEEVENSNYMTLNKNQLNKNVRRIVNKKKEY